jgi:hypothetical protein
VVFQNITDVTLCGLLAAGDPAKVVRGAVAYDPTAQAKEWATPIAATVAAQQRLLPVTDASRARFPCLAALILEQLDNRSNRWGSTQERHRLDDLNREFDRRLLELFGLWQSSTFTLLPPVPEPVKTLRGLLRSDHALSLLTNPFWVTESLPLSLPPSLANTAGRFGWIPAGDINSLSRRGPRVELPPGVVHQSHHATVFPDALDNGHFGLPLLRAQDHLQQPLACRVARKWLPVHKATIDSVLHQLSSARCVVPLAQFCLESDAGDLLVPSDASSSRCGL